MRVPRFGRCQKILFTIILIGFNAHRSISQAPLWEFSFIKAPWSAYTPTDHLITPCASSAWMLEELWHRSSVFRYSSHHNLYKNQHKAGRAALGWAAEPALCSRIPYTSAAVRPICSWNNDSTLINHWILCRTIVEQFVWFFIKIEQISVSKSALQMRRMPFLSNKRILFEYADTAPELCRKL